MDELLEAVRKKSCIMDTAIRKYGSVSLKEYVKQFKPFTGKPIQPADDFLKYAREYNDSLLGKDVAEEIDRVLRFPLLNTANHHGVDFFPPSVQGNLLYWQALTENGVKPKYLPLCSFGIVSLSNSSYARGITSWSCFSKPFRLPIFPKSIENKMVRYVPAFTEEQIKHTIFRLDTEFRRAGAYCEVRRALEKYYLDRRVLEQTSYGNQAVLINRMISEDMYPKGDIPQVIYMEMEWIINRLLLKDLKDENSLIYRILFDRRILEGIIGQMKRGNQFMTTVFFWGKDRAGRRHVLDYCTDGFMRGVTLSGETVEMPASAESLEVLIRQEKIVPSGYTMAILLCFARGYTWLGGYFQGDYLPEWQRGTAEALGNAEEYREWAERILQYDCTGYISGPVFAMNLTEDGLPVPAGPLEIIHNGGIDQKNLDRLLNVTVTDAHRMGLYNSYPELIPVAERIGDWNLKIGEQLLSARIADTAPGGLKEYKKGLKECVG